MIPIDQPTISESGSLSPTHPSRTEKIACKELNIFENWGQKVENGEWIVSRNAKPASWVSLGVLKKSSGPDPFCLAVLNDFFLWNKHAQ